MSFIPQALADPKSRSILFVWRDEEGFYRHWADKVKTIDAPGIWTHPRLIKTGDIIDFYPTGWNKTVVKSIRFVPDYGDIPDYHRIGIYILECGDGGKSVRVDGNKVIDFPLYKFV